MSTRRRFLVGIASLLLLAVVMTAATKGVVPSEAAADLEEIITGRQFSFEIDGKEIPVISVEPGEFRVELKDATMGNRRDNLKDFTATKPQFGTWRVEKHYSAGDLHLKNLFEAFANGSRKTNPSDTGSLIYKDANGNEARRINFFGFTPLHYESISVDSRNAGQAATEVMEFSVSRVEYVSLDRPGGDIPGDVVKSKPSSSAGDPTDSSTGSDIVGFKLDLMQGGQAPAANWYSISGGSQILHLKERAAGSDSSSKPGAPEIEFAEVEIVGPFVSGGSRAELLEVLNTWSTQTGERFNATLELLDSNQQVVRTINFFDCIPTSYSPPSVRAGDDSLLEEKFTFKPERVEG